MKNAEITEEMLSGLRLRVKDYLTDKRYIHVLGVEREAAALGKIYLKDEVNELRAAALLHDITKRLSVEKQLNLLDEFGIIRCGDERIFPKLLHSKTAAALIERDFPEFNDERIVSAVRWHTSGRAGMSVFDMLIYLADYIEDTRTFEDCVKLRAFFYDNLARAESSEQLYSVLDKTMILSFDMTFRILMEEGAPICRDTVEARNWFITKNIHS